MTIAPFLQLFFATNLANVNKPLGTNPIKLFVVVKDASA
jgi:hypothetical protein